MKTAFEGVEKVFFVSSPEADGTKREVQHGNVVRAAVQAGVGMVRPYRMVPGVGWEDADDDDDVVLVV